MRKSLWKKILIYTLSICMVLGMTMAMGIQDTAASYVRYVTASSLNIRKTASGKAAVVGYYYKGDKVTRYGVVDGWTKVKYNGYYRYVSGSYLSSSKPSSGGSSTGSTYTRYLTASTLNVRKTASYSGTVVGSYSKGAKLTCYGRSGDWTKIKYNGYYRYVATQYLSSSKPSSGESSTGSTYTRYVTASTLNVRKTASYSGTVVGSYSKGAKLTCSGRSGDWTKIKYNGYYRYVCTQYLSSSKPSTGSTVTGKDVANYAVQFVGNPYKWGGESLTNGADCSGFTKAVFAHFGYSLPHNSIDQRGYGTAVSWSNKQPGDLICYNQIDGVGHVGIYIGNNQVVHAGSSSTGIHISKADYRSVWGVRRIVR